MIRARTTFALLSSLIITLMVAFPAYSGTVFGPQQYIRTSGAPNTYTDTFQSTGGAGSLIIKNGDAVGVNRVDEIVLDNTITSAKVYLNGTEIFGPSDFKSDVYYMERPVNLIEGTNTLYVELRNAPGSYITAVVDATVTSSITMDITSPSDGAILSVPYVNVQGTIVVTPYTLHPTPHTLNPYLMLTSRGQSPTHPVPRLEW